MPTNENQDNLEMSDMDDEFESYEEVSEGLEDLEDDTLIQLLNSAIDLHYGEESEEDDEPEFEFSEDEDGEDETESYLMNTTIVRHDTCTMAKGTCVNDMSNWHMILIHENAMVLIHKDGEYLHEVSKEVTDILSEAMEED